LGRGGNRKLTQALDYSYNPRLCSAKWFRGRVAWQALGGFILVEFSEGFQANYYLRGSHQRNADRRKEPDKPFF
jgi:hypothetical protein